MRRPSGAVFHRLHGRLRALARADLDSHETGARERCSLRSVTEGGAFGGQPPDRTHVPETQPVGVNADRFRGLDGDLQVRPRGNLERRSTR